MVMTFSEELTFELDLKYEEGEIPPISKEMNKS